MPYNTPDAPPIRLVVLACNKPAALTSLLANLRAVGEAGGFVGHNVSLTLSLDVPRGATSAADAVAALAQNFSWAHGPKAVVRQPQHVGILGQWLSVAPASDDDWAVVLEDDLALSPCFYRHLLAQRRTYGGRRDVAGVTLQALDRHACFVGHGCAEPPTPPFLSPIPGSWGFMPRPAAWRGFVAWQKAHAADDPTKGLPADFQPSAWYRGAAAAGRADSMWTIWHIAYTAAKGQATLVPAPFSAPLVYPHGTQASEHAHARGRPASAAAAAPRAPRRTRAGGAAAGESRRPSTGCSPGARRSRRPPRCRPRPAPTASTGWRCARGPRASRCGSSSKYRMVSPLYA